MEHNLEQLGKGMLSLDNKQDTVSSPCGSSRRPESGILRQGNSLTRFTMPNVSTNFSSLELGSPFNCFTGQPGQRKVKKTDLCVETNATPRIESQMYSITSKNDIRKEVNISSGCFLKAAVNQISVKVSDEFLKKFQSEKERNWFFYYCRYVKTTETLVGEPSSLDKMAGEDTHYVSSITKGGHLYIMYASDKVKTMKDANLLLSEDAKISSDAGSNYKVAFDKSNEGNAREDLVLMHSSVTQLGNISTVEDIHKVIAQFNDVLLKEDTDMEPLWFEMQPIRNINVPQIYMNVEQLATSWDDINDAVKELSDVQDLLSVRDMPNSQEITKNLDDYQKLREQFGELFRHLHTNEPLAMENNASNALEQYKKLCGKDVSLRYQAVKMRKVMFGTPEALKKMIPTEFNVPFTAENNLKVVLIGKTGSGKSTFGNILLGREEFEVSKDKSVTQQFQGEEIVFGRHTITVYDTPGFFDKDYTLALSTLRKLYNEVSDGIHAFALVVHCKSVSDAMKTFKRIKKNHPWTVLKYIVVVFTHMKDQSVEELLKEDFKDLGKEVSGIALGVREACTFPENKEEQTAIREAFFNMVQKTYTNNENKPCTKLVPYYCVLL